MRLNHPDYIKLVIGTYKKKRASHKLSLLLSQPTPGTIREECSNVYSEGIEKKDEPTLRAFFGPGEHGKNFLTAIQNFDLAKFKPLVQYLKKDGNKKINDKSLELLAWLIDFKHRPWVFDRTVILSEEELLIINGADNNLVINPINMEPEDDDEEGEILNENENEESGNSDPSEVSKIIQDPIDPVSPTGINIIRPEPSPEPERPGGEDETVKGSNGSSPSKKALLYFLLFIIFTGVVYTLWQQKQDKQMMAFGNPNTGCMYWDGNHYETISCADKNSDRLKLPLDLEKMRNFKRITREDTMTQWSIGRLYYIKINGGIEFYTTSGHHPVDVTRTLKVVSEHIYETYLDKQKAADTKLVNN